MPMVLQCIYFTHNTLTHYHGNLFSFVYLLLSDPWINCSRLYIASCYILIFYTTCTNLYYSVLILAVTLKIAGDVSVGNHYCPGSTAEFECQTTEGSLLWETSSTFHNHVFDNPTQPPRMLGIFLLSLDGISLLTNGTVSAVNSTAVVSNVQPSNNGSTLKCSENADISMFSETVLRIAGEWCNGTCTL